MAQFSYSQYVKQQTERKEKRKAAGGQPYQSNSNVHFLNEYLKDDGDVVVVRFPYHSMDEVTIETTHAVSFPGEKYPRRVRCSGDDCVLCKQKVKVDSRVFVKVIVYVVNSETGNVELIPAVWDRPAAFADIDLQNLVSEYGDLTDHLFKIKRNGKMQDTTYTISIILNKTVYNPEVYRKDFSSLENVNAANMLTRSIERYLTAIGQKAAEDEQQTSEPQKPAKVVAQSTPAVEEEAEVEEPQPAPQPVPERKVSKYSF